MGGMRWLLDKWEEIYCTIILTTEQLEEFIADCKQEGLSVDDVVKEIGKRV